MWYGNFFANVSKQIDFSPKAIYNFILIDFKGKPFTM